MVALQTKERELRRLAQRGDYLMAFYDDRDAPAEKRREVAKIAARVDDLAEQIEQEKHERKMARDTEALALALGSPAAFDGSLVGLARSGWEVKAEMLYAPDPATGRMVKMWPLCYFTDPIPRARTPEAELMIKAFLSVHPTYRSAWLDWLTAAARTGHAGMAFGQLSSYQQKALSLGSDTGGGFLAPADVQAGIIARLTERSIFRRFGDVRQTARERMLLNRAVEHATEGAVFSSGFVGDWVGETPSQSDAPLSFGRAAVNVFKARARARISNDLLDDAPELLAWLTANGGANLAVVEDRAFIGGDGIGKPLGILNGGAPTVNVAGSTANTISNTTAATGSAPKLQDLEGALPDQYALQGRWLMQRATEKAVRKLVDGQGRFQFPVERTPGGDRLLMDYPVSTSSGMDADGTAGARPILVGDLSSYVVAHRALVSVALVRERYGDTDETLLVLFDRVGGVLANPDAVRVGTV